MDGPYGCISLFIKHCMKMTIRLRKVGMWKGKWCHEQSCVTLVMLRFPSHEVLFVQIVLISSWFSGFNILIKLLLYISQHVSFLRDWCFDRSIKELTNSRLQPRIYYKWYIIGVPFLAKMVHKRVRGWTSGRSLPVLDFVKYPLRPWGIRKAENCWVLCIVTFSNMSL